MEWQADANKDADTITGLARKYCWWMARNMEEEKRGRQMRKGSSLFEEMRRLQSSGECDILESIM